MRFGLLGRSELVILALFAITLAPAQAQGLPHDGTWATPVTLWGRHLLTSEAIKTLAEGAGVDVRLGAGLANRKVCVFAKGKPAWQVLENLAEVSELQWRKEGSSWYLGRSSTLGAESYATAVWAANNKDILDEIKTLAPYAKIAADELQADIAVLQKQAQTIKETAKPGWPEEYERLQLRIAAMAACARPLTSAAVRYLSSLPTARIQALFKNDEFLLASTAGPVQLPPAAIAPLGGADGSPAALLFLQNSTTGMFEFFGGSGVGSEKSANSGKFGQGLLGLDDHPWRKALEAWSTSTPELMRWASGFKQTIPSAKVNWRFRGTCYDEWLEVLANATGIAVVADSWRERINYTIDREVSITDWMRRSTEQDRQLKLESGWLLSRSPRSWQYLQNDPQEASLRLFETAGDPTLDTIAKLAGSLSARAVNRAIYEELCVNGLAADQSYALPALVFWNALSAEQRQIALTRTPILASSLNPAALDALMQAVRTATLGGILHLQMNWDVLMDIVSGKERDALAFFIEVTRRPRFAASTTTRVIEGETKEELERTMSSIGAIKYEITGYTEVKYDMYIGFSAERSFKFTLRLREPLP